MFGRRLYSDPRKRKWTVGAILVGATVLLVALVMVQPLRQKLRTDRATEAAEEGRQLVALVTAHAQRHGAAVTIRDIAGRRHDRAENGLTPVFAEWQPVGAARFAYEVTSISLAADGGLDVCVTISEVLTDRKGPGKVYVRSRPPADAAGWQDGASTVHFLTRNEPVGGCASGGG